MMELICSGMKMTSQQWLAMAGMLFGTEAKVPNVGDVYLRDRSKPLRFGCPNCQREFESRTTPEICPHCQQPPGPQGVTLTHKTHTAVTFPFV